MSLIRFPNLFSAASNVVMGGWLVGASPRPIALGAAAAMCLYAGGVALNDVMDLEKDRTAHPGRPLPSGAISRSAALGAAWALLSAGVGIAWWVGACAGVTALAVMTAVVMYDLLLKQWAWPGALAMGACRALNVELGLSLATDTGWWTFAPVAVCIGAFVAGLTLVSTLEDRPASPVGRWGAALMAGALAGTAGWMMYSGGRAVGWIPFLMVAGVVGTLSLRMRQRRLETDDIGPWVGRLVRSLIVLDAVFAASVGGWAAGATVGSLIVPAWGAKRWLSGGHS